MRRALAVLVVVLFAGCGGPDPMKLVKSAAQFVSFADPKMRAVYEAELHACAAAPTADDMAKCGAAVRAQWAPYHAALVQVHDDWCALTPDAQGCK